MLRKSHSEHIQAVHIRYQQQHIRNEIGGEQVPLTIDAVSVVGMQRNVSEIRMYLRAEECTHSQSLVLYGL